MRYTLSNDERDLETSILQFTHAILLPFPLLKNVISTFFFLTQALCYRSQKSKLPRDVVCCLKYLYYTRSPSFEHIGIAQNKVLTFLVYTLAHQMELEPENAMQCVEEMAVLCCEPLSSKLLGPELYDAVECFAGAVITHMADSLIPPSQQIIKCLSKANASLPYSFNVCFALSTSFFRHFLSTQSIKDYEGAMTPLDRIITSHSSAESPNEYLTDALTAAANVALCRSNFYWTLPEYLEEAISRTRALLISTPLEDFQRGDTIQLLETLERRWFDEFGIPSALPEAHPSNPETIYLPPFEYLNASLAEMNAIESLSLPMEDCVRHFHALDAMKHLTDRTDIDEAIKYCRLLLASLQRSLVHPVSMRDMIIVKSGDFLCRVFNLTNNPKFLDETIDVYRGILKSPTQWIRFSVIRRLILTLSLRFMLSKDRKDFDEMMQLFPIAATYTHVKVTIRFEIACEWAHWARTSGSSSTCTAYECAITLMQESLTFPPSLEIQHSHLVTMRSDVEKLPLAYASYLAHIGQPKQAIENLERGRGLLWSEMRGLRISVDHLRRVDPLLAGRFAALNEDLEALTTSALPTVWSNDGGISSNGEVDNFGRIMVKQRKLLEERSRLITQIRLVPGFENFLLAPPFDTLCSAAAHGPVIIVNHCRWRCDIVILLYDSPPSLISTPESFYDRAEGLKDRLMSTRKEGLDSKEYGDALTFVLEELHDLVGQPVIQRLRKLNVPEQSRVWWCPTSVFCSLPLHAMGPVRSEGSLELYFSDLYIPSYTSTLSALIDSRRPSSHSFEKPSILLVAQPDEFMPAAWDEISLIQRLNTTVTTLISKKATPSAIVEHLRDHRFAHFSCHGKLETGKPFEASFKLHQSQRLTLLDIIRSRLPSAEFAFLSACHTAEPTEESIADEGLHLSAAVQYSGFRSVVGTMWAMADIDGKVLAKHFYASVFSDKRKGVPYYEKTAEALRDAVQVLRRRNNVTTERWVNFVHYGA